MLLPLTLGLILIVTLIVAAFRRPRPRARR
jgi:hypothetical protein